MKKNNKHVRPNFIFWTIYQLGSKVICFFKYHLKVTKNEFKNRDKKSGSVILYNHTSTRDHFFSTATFGATRVNYVITNRFFFKKFLSFILRGVRAIPRDQFKTDMASILKMKRVVEAGGHICIAPAGQVSVDGATPEISPVIVKLLKMFKVDVYMVSVNGGYTCKPKWTKYLRKYPIELQINKILTKDDIASFSADEIYAKVCESLTFDEVEYIKRKNLPIKGKALAESLENILYICPLCKAKYTIETKDDTISCSTCGALAKMGDDGLLHKVNEQINFQREFEWNNFQIEVLKEELNNPDFVKESRVYYYKNNDKNNELIQVGEGILHLDLNSFYYDGTKDNDVYHKDFELDSLFQLPFAPGERFNIPDNNSDDFFEFRPIKPIEVYEWVELIIAYRKLKEENNGKES